MSHYSVEALKLLDDLKIDELMDLRKNEFSYQDNKQASEEAIKLQLDKEKLKEIRESFWALSQEDSTLLAELNSLSDHPSLKDKKRLLKVVPLRNQLIWLNTDSHSEAFIDYLKEILVASSQTRSQKKKAFYDTFRRDELSAARKIVNKIKYELRPIYELESSWFDQILNPRAFTDPKSSSLSTDSDIPWWVYAMSFWFIIKIIGMVVK